MESNKAPNNNINAQDFLNENNEIEKQLQTSNVFSPIEDLLIEAESTPSMEFIWAGIPSISFGFVFGSAKAGKTTFCENLGMLLSSGEQTYLDTPILRKENRVLVLSLEEYWQGRTNRNKMQLQSKQLNLQRRYMCLKDGFPRYINDQKDWDKLEKTIVDSEANVVIIDSLTRLCGGNIEDSKTAKDVTQLLRDMAYKHKICLIVIHHTPKHIGRPLTIDSLAGSRVLAQEADFMLGISRTIDNKRYYKEVSYRYCDDNKDTVIQFEITDNCWLNKIKDIEELSLLENKNDGRVNNINKEKVYDLIEDYSRSKQGFITTKELEQKLVDSKIMGRKTLFNQLNKLVSEGEIEKDRGKYSIISIDEEDE